MSWTIALEGASLPSVEVVLLEDGIFCSRDTKWEVLDDSNQYSLLGQGMAKPTKLHLSHLMTKPTKWHVRPAKISLHCPHEESLGP